MKMSQGTKESKETMQEGTELHVRVKSVLNFLLWNKNYGFYSTHCWFYSNLFVYSTLYSLLSGFIQNYCFFTLQLHFFPTNWFHLLFFFQTIGLIPY